MEFNWLNDPRFNNIDERKKKYLIKMLAEMNGKSQNVAIQSYMKTAAEMKKEGLALTKEEANLMIEYLMANMSPAERQKWNKISQYLKEKK